MRMKTNYYVRKILYFLSSKILKKTAKSLLKYT